VFDLPRGIVRSFGTRRLATLVSLILCQFAQTLTLLSSHRKTVHQGYACDCVILCRQQTMLEFRSSICTLSYCQAKMTWGPWGIIDLYSLGTYNCLRSVRFVYICEIKNMPVMPDFRTGQLRNQTKFGFIALCSSLNKVM